MVEFVVLTIFVLFFAFFAERHNSFPFFFLCVLSLALFSGLRNESVGIDTAQYYMVYHNVLSGRDVYGIEDSFLNICVFLQTISKSPAFLVFFMSSLTNILIISRLWTLRKECSFFVMVAIYISSFYPESMNVMRQFLAVALVFAGTYFLRKKTLWIYIIFCTMAFLFHKTALLGYLLLIVFFIVNKEINKWLRYGGILVFSLVVLISFPTLISLIDAYSRYFNRSGSGIGLIMLYKIILFCLASFIAKFGLYQQSGVFYGKEKMNMAFSVSYAAGLILCSIGTFFLFMDRIALYFMMFEMPFWGSFARSRFYPLFYRSLIFVLVASLYIMYLISDGQKIFPYSTIWSE